jgi:ribosomal protein S18 acetylase RimI-like enzyme
MRTEKDIDPPVESQVRRDERDARGPVRGLLRESDTQSSIRVRVVDRPSAEFIEGLRRQFALDHITDGDTLLVGEIQGQVCGVMAIRMMPLVHDFECMGSRRLADAMLHFARGYVRASGLTEATVLVNPDNGAMHRWLRRHGSRFETTADIFTVEA